MLVHSQSPAENLSYTHVEKWNNTAYQHFLPELEIIKHLSNATLNVVSFSRRVLCFFYSHGTIYILGDLKCCPLVEMVTFVTYTNGVISGVISMYLY